MLFKALCKLAKYSTDVFCKNRKNEKKLCFFDSVNFIKNQAIAKLTNVNNGVIHKPRGQLRVEDDVKNIQKFAHVVYG